MEIYANDAKKQGVYVYVIVPMGENMVQGLNF